MSQPAATPDDVPDSGLTSLSLLHQVRIHDPEAWRRLVHLYSPLVFRWCRRAGLSSEDSADVLQNVFFAVATRVVDFHRDEPGDSFRGWLWGIARFKIADHFRARKDAPEAAGGSTALFSLHQVSDAIGPPNPEPSEAEDRTALLQRALEMIRRDFAEPLRVEFLADKAAMSTSAFHRHFKAVTSLSPLQYQKRVRLLQARTLLIAKGSSVTSAAFDVGYESATQFSREYAREFGLPPGRDSSRLQSGLRR